MEKTVMEAIADKGGCINMNNGIQKEICLDEKKDELCNTCKAFFEETFSDALSSFLLKKLFKT